MALRPGGMQALAALIMAAVVAAVIALSAPADTPVAGRLAIVGVGVVAVALGIGSARMVGFATLPVLAGALLASAAVDGIAWVQSIVLGCLWYIAVELAWDSIERRDGAQRSPALNQRRVHEVVTVVTVSLAVTIPGFVASDLAPQRTLLVQAPLVVGLLTAMVLAIRQLTTARGAATLR